MTTGSATSASASFAPDSYSQRQPAERGNSFAREFAGAASRDRQTSHDSNLHERAPSSHSPGVGKPQKDNSAGQKTATDAPAAAANPIALATDLHLTLLAAQCDLGLAELGATAQPTASSGPQQPATMEGPNLSGGDPQSTAFMMRMQVAVAAGGPTVQQALTDAGISDAKKAGEGSAEDALPAMPPVAQTANALAAFEQGRQLEAGSEVKPAGAPSQAPELRAMRADDQPKAPQPLNNIVLQVNQSATEKVVVRLVQQSGELRLAVRTDDSELAHSLQQGLSDLVGKLHEKGYRADTWQPVQAPSSTGQPLETQNTSSHSRQGDSQSQPGWSQQEGGQQRQNQHNRPRWVEELEGTLTSHGQAPGETYGLTR